MSAPTLFLISQALLSPPARRALPPLAYQGGEVGAVGSRGGQDLEGVVSLRPAGSPTPILALASGLFPLPSHHPHPRERW